jgi:N-acetylglucosaminyl-diphospho-decaprenol L-rhamnosyltransferase
MSIAVVIVSHNTREHLRACLLSAQPESPAETVVVDNASGDGSAEMVETEFPAVKLIRGGNDGFGAGANLGVQATQHPYVLLLNSDTRVQPGALSALERYLDSRPRVGLAGPRLLNPDGTLQPSIYPSPGPVAELMRWTSLARLGERVPLLRRAYLLDHLHDRETEAGWLVGAALALRRTAFDAIGGFDTSYFMYSEEVDLAYRMQLAGWSVRFTPAAEVTHFGGASTLAYRAAMMARLYTSMTHFYRKHYGARAQAMLRVILSYFMVRNLIRDRLRLLRESSEETRGVLADDLTAWRQVLVATWNR